MCKRQKLNTYFFFAGVIFRFLDVCSFKITVSSESDLKEKIMRLKQNFNDSNKIVFN